MDFEATGNNNTQSLGQRSRDRITEAGGASTSNLNGKESGINIQIGHGNEICIKEESNVEVKPEPVNEEVPITRFMASEVDSNDQSKANDGYANPNDARSLLGSKSSNNRAQKSRVSNDPKPLCLNMAKRFECQECGYATKYKSNLKVHIRKHTGDKPHRCEHCSKCYTTSHNLRKHITTHKDVLSFHCSGCFNGFTQENERNDHEKGCSNRRYGIQYLPAICHNQKT